jgi:hypothetical protein
VKLLYFGLKSLEDDAVASSGIVLNDFDIRFALVSRVWDGERFDDDYYAWYFSSYPFGQRLVHTVNVVSRA